MKDYKNKIQEVCPIFTNEVLELLWNWFDGKQNEKMKKSYEELIQNQEFADLIYNITHLKS